jgi:hypothetical protein
VPLPSAAAKPPSRPDRGAPTRSKESP